MWKVTHHEAPFIHFECECSCQAAIEDMYFCSQCTKILCQYCALEEIDSFYCRNCMENMIGSEAMNLKNRCSSCFQCPVCFNKLQILHQHNKNEKFLYLGCQRCYWDSIQQGIKGATAKDIIVACQSYFTKEDPLQKQYQERVEFYKNACKPRRKVINRKKPDDKFTFEDLEQKLQVEALAPQPKASFPAPVSTEQLAEFQFSAQTSMNQRLMNLAEQPASVQALTTQPVPLLTKRSKRCKHCKRYVVKPETRPNNYSHFKMENLLVYFLPRIYIRAFTERDITLVIINPTSSVAFISFDHILVPKHELHLNSYDPAMDLVTTEGSSEPHEMLLAREKNFIVVQLRRVEDDIRLGINWKFTRVSELKELSFCSRIKLK